MSWLLSILTGESLPHPATPRTAQRSFVTACLESLSPSLASLPRRWISVTNSWTLSPNTYKSSSVVFSNLSVWFSPMPMTAPLYNRGITWTLRAAKNKEISQKPSLATEDCYHLFAQGETESRKIRQLYLRVFNWNRKKVSKMPNRQSLILCPFQELNSLIWLHALCLIIF